MNAKQLLFCVLSTSLLYAHSALAQAPSADTVMTITKVEGRALAEMPNGQRLVLKQGMQIPHNARIMILEEGLIKGHYYSDNCEVQYPENTLLHVKRNAPCAQGRQLAKRGSDTKRITKTRRTIPTPAASPTVQVPAQAAAPAIIRRGRIKPLYILGGIGGILLLTELLDDDDNSSTTPVSP